MKTPASAFSRARYFELNGCEPAGGSTFGAANGYTFGTTFTPVVNLNG